jgi:PAS domain S-box-containing protein
VLDLLSLARAARGLSGELTLGDLHQTILRIVQESTGAQYAALLDFSEGQGWSILCQPADAKRTPAEVPSSVLARARASLAPVLHAEVQCHPLAYRGRQHGVLYLERPMGSEPLDEARQGLLELLVTQATLALDNARLHQHLAAQNQAEALSRQETLAAWRQLQELIDHSPAAIYVKDREGRYSIVNTMFESAHGAPRSRILGRDDLELMPQHAEELMRNDRRVLASGDTLQFEESLLVHGELRTFVSLKFPLRSEDGSVHAVAGISTDITDRKQAELALQQAKEQLEQRVAERTRQLQSAQKELLDRARHAGMAEIASSILHNLGNALTGITVSSALLRERIQGLPIGSLERLATLLDRTPEALGAFLAHDEKGKHVPEFVKKLGARLTEERLLLLEECAAMAGKVEHANSVIATQQTYARNRITLRETLRLRELAEDALRLAGISEGFDELIQREYGEEEPGLYERHVIMQILVNLLANAKNAVRERGEGPAPRIALTVNQDARHTTVTVSDNGVGFDERVKARLFTYGFTTRPRGHGFGLHSAALSAQSLGGHIEAYSDGPGKGARFELILPRTRSE